MIHRYLNVTVTFALLLLIACSRNSDHVREYHNREEVGPRTGGVRMIPVVTPVDTFKVWTKRFGNNNRIKILLLHGGPGITHEQLECFESFFPEAGFEFYEYDQLGSYYSDQPTDTSLWNVERMVEEVEQVRSHLGLDSENFYLLGHSWGGMLAMQYALKYQHNLKGLIVANMFADASAQNIYWQTVLDGIEPAAATELRSLDSAGDYNNPRFTALVIEHIMKRRGLRLPEMPEPMGRAFKHVNGEPDKALLGDGGFRIKGKLANVNILEALATITVPSLFIAGAHDFVDPEHIKAMSMKVKDGRYLLCPEGSHNAMWDDPEYFMSGVISFVKDVDKDSGQHD